MKTLPSFGDEVEYKAAPVVTPEATQEEEQHPATDSKTEDPVTAQAHVQPPKPPKPVPQPKLSVELPKKGQYIEGFIDSKEVYDILTIGMMTKQNVLLWGPPGYGKSEMTQAFLKEFFDDVYTLSFGEGMEEALLYGGLDFNALSQKGRLEFFPENSFLNHSVAVFEELFDAPTPVILSLKDTLTARKLRKGTQVFPMKTEFIVGITNKDPDEIASMGDSEKALIERFPLRLRVDWSSSNRTRNFAELLSLKYKNITSHMRQYDSCEDFLEHIVKKDDMSPRTICQIMKTIDAIWDKYANKRECVAKASKLFQDSIGEDYFKELESREAKRNQTDLINRSVQMTEDQVSICKSLVSTINFSADPASLVKQAQDVVKELKASKTKLEQLQSTISPEAFMEELEDLVHKTKDNIAQAIDKVNEMSKEVATKTKEKVNF